MPNISYMLVNFVYLSGMALWVGLGLAGLLLVRGELRQAPQAAPALIRLMHLQTLSLLAAGAAAAVKAVVWESMRWPFLARYVGLAFLGAIAPHGVGRLVPALRGSPPEVAMPRAASWLGAGLVLGLVVLLLS